MNLLDELAWNVLKDFLEYEGIGGLVGSRSTVREAFKRGLISDGQLWMDMVDQRNHINRGHINRGQIQIFKRQALAPAVELLCRRLLACVKAR